MAEINPHLQTGGARSCQDIDEAVNVLYAIVEVNIARASLPRGERLSIPAIAESCGCAQSLIWQVEKRALQKLYKGLRKKMGMTPREFEDAFSSGK